MKSDRRTLIVGVVFLCFLILSSQFQSLFLFGARLLPGQIQIHGGNYYLNVSESPNTIQIGSWSIQPEPDQSGQARNEKLGLALVQTEKAWHEAESNRRDASLILEKYCQDNPSDLAAKAHLLRLMLNLRSLEKVRYKDRLTTQAKRLILIANEAAAKEPHNWYWRERQFHLLALIGENTQAINIWIAKPLPKRFDDYVFDEIVCKEALYRSRYWNLPKSALYPIWAGVLFPHFSTVQQLETVMKSSDRSSDMRVSLIEYGHAMVKSCPTAIAGMIGINNIRKGIWNNQPKIANKWQDFENLAEQAKIERIYKAALSQSDWEYCLRLAKSEIVPNFLQADQNLTGLYVGQYGPFAVYAGVSCILLGLGFAIFRRLNWKAISSAHAIWPVLLTVLTHSDLSFALDLIFIFVAFGLFLLLRKPLSETSIQTVTWPMLLLVLTFSGSKWRDWGYLANGTFLNQYLAPVIFVLAIVAIVYACRMEKGRRLLPSLVVVTACLLAMAYSGWQGSSIIFLIGFVMQKGNTAIRPWTVAVLLLLAGYHFALNLGSMHLINESHLGFLCLAMTLFMLSKLEREPDEPRLQLVTLGIGAAILGTFFIGQYDKGLTTAMENDLKQIEQVREKFANL